MRSNARDSTRRLIVGGMGALGSKGLVVVSAMVANRLLTRIMPPNNIGTYFLVASLVALGAILAQLGLGPTVVRGVARALGLNDRARARSIVRSALRWQWAGVSSVGVVFGLGSGWLGLDPALACLGVVWMGVVAWNSLLTEILRGFRDLRAMANLHELVSSLAFTILLLSVWRMRYSLSVDGIVLLRTIAGGVALSIIAQIVPQVLAAQAPPVGDDPGKQPEHILAQSWPVLANSLTGVVLVQIDIWILSVWRSPPEVALYGAAARLATLVALPLVIVNAVLPPVIAKLFAQGRRDELERVVRRAATLAGIPAAITLLAFVLGGARVLQIVYSKPKLLVDLLDK